MCLLAGHKKLEDEYKATGVLLKINKSDMAKTNKAIKKYLRSH